MEYVGPQWQEGQPRGSWPVCFGLSGLPPGRIRCDGLADHMPHPHPCPETEQLCPGVSSGVALEGSVLAAWWQLGHLDFTAGPRVLSVNGYGCSQGSCQPVASPCP